MEAQGRLMINSSGVFTRSVTNPASFAGQPSVLGPD
jgi:hypothetical protein